MSEVYPPGVLEAKVRCEGSPWVDHHNPNCAWCAYLSRKAWESDNQQACREATSDELLAELLNRTSNFDPPFNPNLQNVSPTDLVSELSDRLRLNQKAV